VVALEIFLVHLVTRFPTYRVRRVQNNNSFSNINFFYVIKTLIVYPVKTNVMGPIDFGIMPNAISYPASLSACLAIIEFL